MIPFNSVFFRIFFLNNYYFKISYQPRTLQINTNHTLYLGHFPCKAYMCGTICFFSLNVSFIK